MNLSYVHGVGTTPLLEDTIGGALNRAHQRSEVPFDGLRRRR